MSFDVFLCHIIFSNVMVYRSSPINNPILIKSIFSNAGGFCRSSFLLTKKLLLLVFIFGWANEDIPRASNRHRRTLSMEYGSPRR
jgi:hypothetical protein